MEFSMIKKVITILEYILAVLVFILAFAVLFQIDKIVVVKSTLPHHLMDRVIDRQGNDVDCI